MIATLSRGHRGTGYRGGLRHRRVLCGGATTRTGPVDDRALLAVTGNIHRYGDRRMPVPGVLGLVAAAISAVFAAASGRWAQAGAAGASVGLLLVWLLLYLRVSAPINHQLIAGVDRPELATNARALQHNWDKVITTRATLQGLAVAALCLALLV